MSRRDFHRWRRGKGRWEHWPALMNAERMLLWEAPDRPPELPKELRVAFREFLGPALPRRRAWIARRSPKRRLAEVLRVAMMSQLVAAEEMFFGDLNRAIGRAP